MNNNAVSRLFAVATIITFLASSALASAQYIGYVQSGTEPLADATVEVSTRCFTIAENTDQTGKFMFHDLPDGEYSVRVSKQGYRDSSVIRVTSKGGVVSPVDSVQSQPTFNLEETSDEVLEVFSHLRSPDTELYHWEESIDDNHQSSPGKLKRFDIIVQGGSREDKRLYVEAEVYPLDTEPSGGTEGVIWLVRRDGKEFGHHLQPDGDPRPEHSTVFTDNITIGKFEWGGPYVVRWRYVKDVHGNRIRDGVNELNFGRELYIDNELEDTEPPKYIENSVFIKYETNSIVVEWSVNENAAMRDDINACRAWIYDQKHRIYGNGYFNAGRNICSVTFGSQDLPQGVSVQYEVVEIKMRDLAKNSTSVNLEKASSVRTTQQSNQPTHVSFSDSQVAADVYNWEQSQSDQNLSFPGQIRRVDITIKGGPLDDKRVRIELEIHPLDGRTEGAVRGFMRLHSEHKTYIDRYFYPVGLPRDSKGTILATEFTIGKHERSGHYTPGWLRFTDVNGLEFDRERGDFPFGWELFIVNPLEDTVPPKYVSSSMSLTKGTVTRDSVQHQTITAEWQVLENIAMRKNWACYAQMNDEIEATGRITKHAHFDKDRNICSVVFTMSKSRPSSTYRLDYISMTDSALNKTRVSFREREGYESPQKIYFFNDNADTSAPIVDLSGMTITASPLSTGDVGTEFLVTLNFLSWDDNSGFGFGHITLKGPNGARHFEYISHDSVSGTHEDAGKVWNTHIWTDSLLVDGAFGRWVVEELVIQDRAGNIRKHVLPEGASFDVNP